MNKETIDKIDELLDDENLVYLKVSKYKYPHGTIIEIQPIFYQETISILEK